MKKLLCAALICAFSVCTVYAHEFIVKPVSYKAFKSGDIIPLELYSTHYFIAGEELEPIEFNTLYVLQNGKKIDLKLTPNEEKLVYETSYKLADNTPAIVVGKREGMLYSTTTKGGQEGDRKELTAKGFTVLKTTLYEKFSKTFLNPSQTDTSYQTPIGQALEIVPVTNPADFAKGKPATFKILYNGTPVKAPFNATYDGFNSKDEKAYAVTSESGTDGLVTLTPAESGVWMVQTGVTVKSGNPGYDDLSQRSVAVFEVR